MYGSLTGEGGMNQDKVKLFIELAGQRAGSRLNVGNPQQRALGAQLLLSEVLEYIINGLGVVPEFGGTAITDANDLTYKPVGDGADLVEMVDGLADTAYTMYWNAVTFGVPLEEAFELVCDNNLEKFVRLENWNGAEGELSSDKWDLGLSVSWPVEVAKVEIVRTPSGYFAVGKDKNGKVRKPSSYASVNLDQLVARAANS